MARERGIIQGRHNCDAEEAVSPAAEAAEAPALRRDEWTAARDRAWSLLDEPSSTLPWWRPAPVREAPVAPGPILDRSTTPGTDGADRERVDPDPEAVEPVTAAEAIRRLAHPQPSEPAEAPAPRRRVGFRGGLGLLLALAAGMGPGMVEAPPPGPGSTKTWPGRGQ